MDYALSVNYHINIILLHPEKMCGFYNFKSLVRHGSGIYGHFFPHAPRGMAQSVLRTHIFKLGGGFSEERATGGRQNQLFYAGVVALCLKALKYRGMFAVHRKNFYPMLCGIVHNAPAPRHKGFLVCKGNVVSGFDGGYGWAQSGYAGYCVEHDVTLRRRRFERGVLAAEHRYSCAGKCDAQAPCDVFVRHGNKLRSKLPRLLFKQLRIAARRKRDYLISKAAANIQRLRTD